MPLEPSGLYEFARGLGLRVSGGSAAVRYFHSEYGPAAAVRGDAAVEIGFGAALDDEHARIAGAHKTVAWTASLGESRSTPLRCGIVLRGRPRSFALSLVQGYVVEPLLGIAAARAGLVLLPGAGIVARDGTLLVLGRSRSGKSTLTARALAQGLPVLGDDHVLLEPGGRCLSFPRRIRAYGDLALTAPAAYKLLPRATRATLFVGRAVQTLSRGYVAPPVHVPPSALRRGRPHGGEMLARIALVERSSAIEDLRVVEAGVDDVVAFALAVLEEQRVHICAAGDGWAEAAAATAELQRRLLRRAFSDTPAYRVSLPQAWPAARAAAALAGSVLPAEDEAGLSFTRL
jgi:hypothetical protein